MINDHNCKTGQFTKPHSKTKKNEQNAKTVQKKIIQIIQMNQFKGLVWPDQFKKDWVGKVHLKSV